MAWIRVGDLLVADDTTSAGLVNSPSSLTRAALDELYDKTSYASQAAALSGTAPVGAMSPLRTREAFDQWLPSGFDQQAYARRARIARIELVSGSGLVAAGNTSFFRILGTGTDFVVTDPLGVIGAVGSSITIPRAGWYRLSMTMAIGGTSDTAANFNVGWAVSPNAREDSWAWIGVERSQAQGGPSRANSTITWYFPDGAGVTPAYDIAEANVRNIGVSNRSQNRVTVEYLGGL